MTANAKIKFLLVCRLYEGKKPVISLVCAPEQSHGEECILSSYSGWLLVISLDPCSANYVTCLESLFGVWQSQCLPAWLNLFWSIQLKIISHIITLVRSCWIPWIYILTNICVKLTITIVYLVCMNWNKDAEDKYR